MKSQQIKRMIFAVLLLAWLMMIFAMSAQPAQQSSQLSGGLVSKIISVLYPNLSELSQSAQTSIIHNTTLVVRKAAHFFEYFVLGVLAILTANTFNKYKFFNRAVLATAFCVLYAISDEIHQHFVPGRACRFIDILIDSSGIIAAIFTISIITSRKRSGEQNA